MAAVNVNNRVKAAEPRLPEEVRRNGVIVQKRSNDILQVVAMESGKGRYNTLFLSNYASLNIVDELKRVKGVGDVTIFGAQDYSMRVWLKPDRMAQLGLTASDIAAAIKAQNAQNAAGKIGQEPAPDDQMLAYTVTAKGRLLTPEEFGNIVIRASGPGGVLRLKDVARLELGAYSYDQSVTLDGQPTIAMGVFLQTGANALEVAQLVRDRMDTLKKKFPEGMNYVIPFDTTLFVSASITEVVKTLVEAMILVLAVVYIFLQSWRATLIPMVAVPISLIGTFAGLWLFGFSINTLTLFAMVLAIGIVVDDAIVVLENVERLMAEEKLSPRDAAIKAMQQVQGALVAIVLVLCAVFVPVAFLGGIAGQLYKQFAVTVAVAVVLSGVVALTLTPALCALLLKAQHTEHKLFRPFNRLFARITRAYTGTVGLTLKHGIIGGLIFALVIGTTFVFFRVIPGSFVPSEDQGYLISALMLPDGATLKRTQRHRRKHARRVGAGSRRQAHLRRLRLRPDRRRQQAQCRHHLHPAQGLEPTPGQGAGPGRQVHGHRHDAAGRHGAGLQPAADHGTGYRRRFRGVFAEPRRWRHQEAERGRPAVHRRSAEAPGIHPHQHLLPPHRAATVRREWTSRRPWRSAFRWPASTSRCKAPWARCTSTTSTRPAASIGCSCRPRPATA
jgi:hydrophobe/amphiphile efflux-1 (HAE1) family protein